MNQDTTPGPMTTAEKDVEEVVQEEEMVGETGRRERREERVY